MIVTTDDGARIPYPILVLRGRLRLSGLDPIRTERILHRLEKSADNSYGKMTENEMEQLLREQLTSVDMNVRRRLELITEYYERRRDSGGPSPLTIVLEGASATGKSVLALELAQDLTATRIVGTDTVRQMLRTQVSPDEHPELFCHTYQAHRYAQAGPEDLSPAVRGYLAQSELIRPHVISIVDRIMREGADCIVEGVHIQPGILNRMGTGVVEVVIDPVPDTHRAMFIGKSRSGGLKTVSANVQQRLQEFEVTREIQRYLVHCAEVAGVHIVQLVDYSQALDEIRSYIVDMIERMVLRE